MILATYQQAYLLTILIVTHSVLLNSESHLLLLLGTILPNIFGNMLTSDGATDTIVLLKCIFILCDCLFIVILGVKVVYYGIMRCCRSLMILPMIAIAAIGIPKMIEIGLEEGPNGNHNLN